MGEIKIIPEEWDGKALRGVQKGKYLRLDGKEDHEEIQTAMDDRQTSKWFMNPDAWERVFGGRGND